MSHENSSREKQTLAFPSLGLVVEPYLMSQDINVVSHVPGRCSDILPVLSILKLHLSLQIGLLDHFHLEKETGKERRLRQRGEAAEGSTPTDGNGAGQGHSKGAQWTGQDKLNSASAQLTGSTN